MDAKSRANFINSVASGNNVPCPSCGGANEPGHQFCVFCGAKIIPQKDNEKKAAAFKPVKKAAAPVKANKYVEPNNAFAQGLPEWSIEPPQVMVRRH